MIKGASEVKVLLIDQSMYSAKVGVLVLALEVAVASLRCARCNIGAAFVLKQLLPERLAEVPDLNHLRAV